MLTDASRISIFSAITSRTTWTCDIDRNKSFDVSNVLAILTGEMPPLITVISQHAWNKGLYDIWSVGRITLSLLSINIIALFASSYWSHDKCPLDYIVKNCATTPPKLTFCSRKVISSTVKSLYNHGIKCKRINKLKRIK